MTKPSPELMALAARLPALRVECRCCNATGNHPWPEIRCGITSLCASCNTHGYTPNPDMGALLDALDAEGYWCVLTWHRVDGWEVELWHEQAISNAKHFRGSGTTRDLALQRAACAALGLVVKEAADA